MANLIHPSAVIGKNVCIEENVIIGPNCTLGFPGYQNNDEIYSPETIIGKNSIISANSVICRGTKIGENCRLDYHSYIGENCCINKNCVIEYAGRVYNNVRIGQDCSISGFICNDCVIDEGSIIQGIIIHRFKNVRVIESRENSPIIGKHCFIGRNAIIVGDIIIADNCFIACGAIVTQSTIPGKLYKGIPAKEHGNAPKSYLEGNGTFNSLNFNKVYESISRYTSI